MSFRPAALIACLSSLCVVTLLSGCSMNNLEPVTTTSHVAIQGVVHGGQQPIVGAHVYMFQAATTGYGAAATSELLSLTGTQDSIGYYVTTGAGGAFNIYGEYSCTSGAQVYLYALGGNSGSGTTNNTAAGLLAGLGACPTSGSFGSTVPYIFINEVSTVATAYAIAGFANDALHVSSSGSALAQTDIANAFLNVANLEGIGTGTAYTTTPAGNGTVPTKTINTLANIIASCINSTGASSSACTTLFGAVKSAGLTGTTATDTATAMIYIAHNPAVNVTTLFNLVPASPPFGPSLTSAPNDYTLGIIYTGQGASSGGLDGAYSVAIDAVGNAWFTNTVNNSVSKLSSTGAPLSPSNGYTAGNQVIPTGIAIDLNGNAWVTDAASSSLTEYAANGVVTGTFNGGGLTTPQAVAIDGLGNVWVVNNGTNNSISKFTSSGVAVSPSTGYVGGGLSNPTSIAIDGSENVWVPNQLPAPGNLSKFSNSGVALSGTAGFLGGGINNPLAVAIDSSNNVWLGNYSGNSVSEFTNSGSVLSGTTGFTGAGVSRPYALAIDGAGTAWICNYNTNSVSQLATNGTAISPAAGYAANLFASPKGIDIDGSGNVWVASSSLSSTIAVTQLIGAATPRVTPLAAAVKAGTVAVRP